MALPNETTLIAAKILVEVKDALSAFKVLDAAVGNSALKISNMAKAIAVESKKSGRSIREITDELIKLNAAAKPGALGKLNVPDSLIRGAGELANNVKLVDDNIQKVGVNGTNALSRVLSATNVLNISFGILASTLIRNVLQAFGNLVSTALKGLNELEAAMFNISTAEEKLSKQGIEISVTGLEKIIADLQVLDPMLSRFQATELISVLATKVAPAARLTEKELGNLSEVITILAVKNQSLGKSFEEVQQQFVTGVLSGRVTTGINQLGAKITEQAVQEEALRQGLIKTTAAYRELSSAEKARVDILSITTLLQRDNAVELARLPEFMETASGLMGILKKESTDFLTSIGEVLAPLIKSVLSVLIDALKGMNAWIEKNKDALSAMGAVVGKFVESEVFIKGLSLAFKVLFGAINLAFAAASKMLDILNKIADRVPFVRKIFDAASGVDRPDTPTGTGFTGAPGIDENQQDEDQKKAQEHGEKLADIFQDNADKLEDIERDYQRKRADIALDFSQKIQDIARNTAEKREDAERNYSEKIEDINRDANQKIADAQADFRKKEEDREAEYQNRLRELREKFLFDLEDALAARDARQVLRLIRQYNLDKKNLEERRKLQKKDDELNLQRKLEDIERERILKLEAAKREYDDKLKEIAIGEARALAEARRWRTRQLADARLHYQRQLADQREFLRRKLADLAAAYAQELSMANNYFSSLSSAQAGAASSPSSPSGGNFASTNPFGGIGSGLYNPYDIRTIYKQLGIPGFADGGTLVARKPTLALFGEKSPEAATFTPLNKGGGFNASFGSNGGMGGQLDLRISISEGLIADIVNSSLEGMAAHVEHVRRAE